MMQENGWTKTSRSNGNDRIKIINQNKDKSNKSNGRQNFKEQLDITTLMSVH